MYRFISVIWNPSHADGATIARLTARQLQAHGSGWRLAHTGSGVLVLDAGQRPGQMQRYPLHRAAGVVLGKLFARRAPDQAPAPHVVLDGVESRRIVETCGTHLVEHYWGRYVAILRNENTGSQYVLRDPTGAFPCLHTSCRGAEIFFSDINDVARLEFLEFSVNWSYLARHLVLGPAPQHQTGLRQVSEVLPGERVEITVDAMARSFCWSPKKIAQTCGIENPAEAARLLHATTVYCITNWARCYRTILHRLSGGLDSSIVLSCLTATPTPLEIIGANAFTPLPDGDERRFARLAARHARIKLIEHAQEVENTKLECLAELPRSAVPENALFAMDRMHFEARVRKETGAEAIFSGAGGDGLFFQPKSFCAADYVQRNGLRMGLLRVAMESARLQRVSFWSALRSAVKEGRSGGSWNPCVDYYPGRTSLINPEIASCAHSGDDIHPWYVPEDNIPRGKLLHIFLATTAPAYYEPALMSDGCTEPVNPLCSQPLIELCLGIPTYVLTAGGRDRGLARTAFADDVPPEIIQRESKGTTNSYLLAVYRRNLQSIREFLLDGILTKERLLDRANLERALIADDVHIDAEWSQILCHVGTEAWLRSWTGGSAMASQPAPEITVAT